MQHNNNDNKGGRPKVLIDKEKLKALLEMGFNVSEIAAKGLLGCKVHRNTISNFMKAEHMVSPRKRFSTLPDRELSAVIKILSDEHPNSGYREIGALLARDPPIVVQMERLNRLLRTVDPVGTQKRWSLLLKRRVYKVPTANYLWHMDILWPLSRIFYFSYISILNGKKQNYS